MTSLTDEQVEAMKAADDGDGGGAYNLSLAEVRSILTELTDLRERLGSLTAERDEASAHVAKLQAALMFWMPGVSEAIEVELNGRAGDDAYLLAGYAGEFPATCWGDDTLARALAAEERLGRYEAALARIIDANDDYLRHNPHGDPDALTTACDAARPLLPALHSSEKANG